MKISEARLLKKGTKVEWNIGGGWYATGKFIKITKVTTFPKMTFSDLIRGNFDLSKGKEEWKCEVRYMDRGKERIVTLRPRALKVVEG